MPGLNVRTRVLMAAGAVMMVAGPKSQDFNTGGNSAVRVYWKATGAIWIGVGGVLTVVGLTRRE